MLKSLFTHGAASDPGYVNIHNAKYGPLLAARYHCEYLWILFQAHADDKYGEQIRHEFDARYWEMYLTTSLILAGHSVTCPKPQGPDVGIVYKGQRIWFEATSPTGGKPGEPDSIGEAKNGKVPEEKIILRYTNSIATKYKEQYASWLKKGIVSESDALVIALNPRSVPHDNIDTDPARILQAAFRVGQPYATVNPETMKVVGVGYKFRDKIQKGPKGEKKKRSEVQTGVFQTGEYPALSGLLCSRVDAANHPGEMGDDFQLVPNPLSSVRLPAGFRLRGLYYDVNPVKDGYEVKPIKIKKPPCS
jgi:hypothetical protein